MARLAGAGAATDVIARLDWAVRRAWRWLGRRMGRTGMVLALCAAVVLSSWVVHRKAEDALMALDAAARTSRQPPGERVSLPVDDAAVGLAAFDAHLLAAEDIPQALQDLLALADEHNLLLSRGDYKALPDAGGGFLRYHMTWPVRGEAQAIQRFIAAALKTNKTLALQTVNFKRETLSTTLVEARIQWVLLTRLPELGQASRPGSRS